MKVARLVMSVGSINSTHDTDYYILDENIQIGLIRCRITSIWWCRECAKVGACFYAQ